MAAATPPWTSRLRNYIRGAVDETLFRLQYTIAEVWSTSELLDSVWREQDNIEPSRGDEDATRNGGDEAQRSDYSLPALQSFESWLRERRNPLFQLIETRDVSRLFERDSETATEEVAEVRLQLLKDFRSSIRNYISRLRDVQSGVRLDDERRSRSGDPLVEAFLLQRPSLVSLNEDDRSGEIDPERLQLCRENDVKVIVCVPLLAFNRVVGCVAFSLFSHRVPHSSGEPSGPQEALDVVSDLGQSISLQLETALESRRPERNSSQPTSPKWTPLPFSPSGRASPTISSSELFAANFSDYTDPYSSSFDGMFNRSNRSIDLSGKLSGPSEEKKGIGQYLGDEFLRANDCFPSFGEDNDEAQRRVFSQKPVETSCEAVHDFIDDFGFYGDVAEGGSAEGLSPPSRYQEEGSAYLSLMSTAERYERAIERVKNEYVSTIKPLQDRLRQMPYYPTVMAVLKEDVRTVLKIVRESSFIDKVVDARSQQPSSEADHTTIDSWAAENEERRNGEDDDVFRRLEEGLSELALEKVNKTMHKMSSALTSKRIHECQRKEQQNASQLQESLFECQEEASVEAAESDDWLGDDLSSLNRSAKESINDILRQLQILRKEAILQKQPLDEVFLGDGTISAMQRKSQEKEPELPLARIHQKSSLLPQKRAPPDAVETPRPTHFVDVDLPLDNMSTASKDATVVDDDTTTLSQLQKLAKAKPPPRVPLSSIAAEQSETGEEVQKESLLLSLTAAELWSMREQRLKEKQELRKRGYTIRGGLLPREAVRIMESWLLHHFTHPYPSKDERKELAATTGLQETQVNNWFGNVRIRIWRPIVRQIENLNNVDEETTADVRRQLREAFKKMER